MPTNHTDFEKRLWDAADELRANSKLKSSEYSVPVLGLIFLRYADHKFAAAQKELAGKSTGRRVVDKTDYQARGVLYLPEAARFSTLLQLPEGANIGKAINDAMRAIETENDELKDVLPRSYNALDNATLVTLLKTFAAIPMDLEGDAFGKIYEYFLGKFAMSEGQKGGEFFTPTSLVKLIVEVIEPFHGRIYDPACGSGGMFVQSARFVENHQALTPGPSPRGRGETNSVGSTGRGESPNSPPSPAGRGAGGEGVLSVYGQEKVAETVRLCKMNLAVHGLSGDVRQGNSYYEDIHKCIGKFDFVMANPPFNVDKVDKERLKDDPRFAYGPPRVDNANYLWIQLFHSALNAQGRAGFVMANSASDARGSELEIRKQLIQSGVVDVMIAIGTNFFYTVTLPCTLWFFDMAKTALLPSPPAPLPEGEGRPTSSPGLVPLGEGSSKSSASEHYRGGLNISTLVERARELRTESTTGEALLWHLLRDRQLLGLKFRRQHQIGSYIVDFYCHEAHLVVEVDGPHHEQAEQHAHDRKRDAYLTSLGNRVLRLGSDEVLSNPEKTLRTISETVRSTDSPLPLGEGLGVRLETLCSSSTRVTSFDRSTVRIATSLPSTSTSSPTSCGSIAAKRLKARRRFLSAWA